MLRPLFPPFKQFFKISTVWIFKSLLLFIPDSIKKLECNKTWVPSYNAYQRHLSAERYVHIACLQKPQMLYSSFNSLQDKYLLKIHTYTHKHTHAHAHIYIYIYILYITYMYIYMRMYVYIYICIYTDDIITMIIFIKSMSSWVHKSMR